MEYVLAGLSESFIGKIVLPTVTGENPYLTVGYGYVT